MSVYFLLYSRVCLLIILYNYREVWDEIKKAKLNYKMKIEQQDNGNLKAAGKGMKCMASIDQTTWTTKHFIRVNSGEDMHLANAFNSSFFTL